MVSAAVVTISRPSNGRCERTEPCSVIVEMDWCTKAAEHRKRQSTYEALMYWLASSIRPESFAAYKKSPASVNVIAPAMSHTAGVRVASPNSRVASENNTIVLIASVAP